MKKATEYFLSVVQSLEDLPAPVAEIVRQANLRAATIYTVPPQEYPIVLQNRFFSIAYGQRTTPHRTLVFGADRLLVIEREAAIRQIVIPYEALVSVEVAVVLLYAYATFTWMHADALETLKIEYNAVGESFIRAEVQRLRLTKPHLEPAFPHETEAILQKLPLKFRNYLRFSLATAEQVFGAVFQPAVDFPRWSLRPRLSGDRTVAITTAGITIVEEEDRRILSYGIRTRYFPLSSLERIDFRPTEDSALLCLSAGGRETLIPLSFENAHQVYALLGHFPDLLPAAAPDEALMPVKAR